MGLIGSFAWIMAGNATYTLCQWAIIVLVAKLSTPEVVGSYAWGLAITAPVMLFCNLQLRALQATDAAGVHPFSAYFALRVLTTGVALLTVVAIVLVLRRPLDTVLVTLAVAAVKAVDNISDITYGLMMRHERMRDVGLSYIVRGLLSVTIVGLSFALTRSLALAVSLMAITSLAVLALLDWRNTLRTLGVHGGGPGLALSLVQAPARELAGLAWLGLPLGAASLLMSWHAAVPIYFLEAHHGLAAVGLFASLSYLALGLRLPVEALAHAASPRVGRLLLEDPRRARRLLTLMVAMGGGFGLAGMLGSAALGSQVLALFYQPDYARHPDVLVLLMASSAVYAVCGILGVALTAARYTWLQLVILSVSLLANVALSSTFIPVHELRGAAWGSLGGSFVWVLAAWGAVFARRPSRQTQVPLVGGG